MNVKEQQLETCMEKPTSLKLGKKCQDCLLSPCLFNLHAEYIMQNVGLDGAGINIAGRNINNLRCTADTILTAGSEEELKSLLMRVKEES